MIVGIVSGKLLRTPTTLFNKRGKPYAIGKLSAKAYANSNLYPQPLQADLIAFDRLAVVQLLSCKQDDVISVAGVITPVVDKSIALDVPITLKITVHRVLSGYVHRQAQGKGWLFEWLP